LCCNLVLVCKFETRFQHNRRISTDCALFSQKCASIDLFRSASCARRSTTGCWRSRATSAYSAACAPSWRWSAARARTWT
jgi:hypothetical protein